VSGLEIRKFLVVIHQRLIACYLSLVELLLFYMSPGGAQLPLDSYKLFA